MYIHTLKTDVAFAVVAKGFVFWLNMVKHPLHNVTEYTIRVYHTLPVVKSSSHWTFGIIATSVCHGWCWCCCHQLAPFLLAVTHTVSNWVKPCTIVWRPQCSRSPPPVPLLLFEPQSSTQTDSLLISCFQAAASGTQTCCWVTQLPVRPTRPHTLAHARVSARADVRRSCEGSRCKRFQSEGRTVQFYFCVYQLLNQIPNDWVRPLRVSAVVTVEMKEGPMAPP